MLTQTVEREWVTRVGYKAVCIWQSMGFRCGYVAVPPDHVLYGVGYHGCHKVVYAFANPDEPIPDEFDQSWAKYRYTSQPAYVINVHGGLTFSTERDEIGNDGTITYPVPSRECWWFGFDCGHVGDGQFGFGGEIRSLAYVVNECESLANQLYAIQVFALDRGFVGS